MSHVEVSPEASPRVVSLVGDVVAFDRHDLQAAFDLRDGEFEVIIDLSRATFIDSTVIGEFVAAQLDGVRVTITGANDVVLRTLTLTGIDQVIRIR